MATQEEGEYIRVFCRIRPSDDPINSVLNVHDQHRLEMVFRDKIPRSFSFDGIHDQNSSQENVFDSVASRIIGGCLVGFNGTILAYGQTGSGKTHTMIGPSLLGESSQGIIPRSLIFLFKHLEEKQQELGTEAFRFSCAASFVELHNECIYDLLVNGDEKLKLSVDEHGAVSIRGVTEQIVTNAVDALRTVEVGWRNRSVAETAMNRASSRSHALLILKLRTEVVENGMSKERKSCINLVDLAGSEKAAQSKAEGDRLKEASHINKSLTVLGRVIRILSSAEEKKKAVHVPYRDSQLTHLLKDSLGGNSRTSVIVNVHPDLKYYPETLSTLTFANSVRLIKNKLVVNEDLKGESVSAYENEIKRMGEELERIKMDNEETVKELKKEIEEWRKAASVFQEQLSVSRRYHALIATREGKTAAMDKEGKIWNESMKQIAASAVKSSSVKKLHMRDLRERLDQCEFEKAELNLNLEAEKKAKAEVQEKLQRALEGTLSPIRQRRKEGEGDRSKSMGNNSMTPSDKRERRRTRFTPAPDRKSEYFRPVLEMEGEEEDMNSPLPIDEEVEREKEETRLEMQVNSLQQVVDEKKSECQSLEKLLKEAVVKAAEEESKSNEAMEKMKIEKERNVRIEEEKRNIEIKLSHMTAENDSLRDVLSTRECEVEELKESLQRAGDELEVKKETMKREQEKFILEQSKGHEAEGQMKRRLDQMEKELKKKNEEEETLKTSNKAYEQLMGEFRSEVKKARQEKKERDEKLNEIVPEYEEMKKSIEGMQGDIESLIKERETLQEEKAEEIEKRIVMDDEWKKKLDQLNQMMDGLGKSNEEEKESAKNAFDMKMEEMRTTFACERNRLESDKKNLEIDLAKVASDLSLSEREKENTDAQLKELASHHNKRQKIHVFERYKNENFILKQQVQTLQFAIIKSGHTLPTLPSLSEEDQHERSGHSSQSQSSRSLRNNSKLNSSK